MSKTASKTGRLGSLIAKAWSRLFLATRKLLSEGRPAANCRRFCSSARSLGFGLKIAFPSSGFGRHGANGIRVLKGVFRSQSTILRWTAFRTGPSGIGHTLSGRAFRVPVAAARCPADFAGPGLCLLREVGYRCHSRFEISPEFGFVRNGWVFALAYG